MQGVASRLESLNREFGAGNLSPEEWAAKFHEQLIEGHLQALRLGHERAGDFSYHVDDFKDADGKIQQGLRNLARGIADGQSDYLLGYADDKGVHHRGFLEDLKAKDSRYFDENGEFREGSMDARSDLYVGNMRGTANVGFVDGLGDDEEIDWVLGAENHCPDCPEYAALSPYTKDTLVAYPGDGNSACLGNCRCELVTRSGKQGFGHHNGAEDVEGDSGRLTPNADPLTENIFSQPSRLLTPLSSEVIAQLIELLGEEPLADDLANMVGALGGSDLSVMPGADPDDVDIQVHHPSVKQMRRTIVKDGDDLVMVNQVLELKPRAQKQGLGLRMLGMEVMTLSALGFKEIRAFCDRSKMHPNAYWIWPLMGFDAVLPSGILNMLPADLAGCETLSELLDADGGAEWWRLYGIPIEATFDLAEGSKSMKQLHNKFKINDVKFKTGDIDIDDPILGEDSGIIIRQSDWDAFIQEAAERRAEKAAALAAEQAKSE